MTLNACIDHGSSDIAEKCGNYYKQSHELAVTKLPAANPLRLGVALNYSVYIYEIASDSTSANQVAKTVGIIHDIDFSMIERF